MSRRALRLAAFFMAFVVLSAGDCEIGSLGDILDEPGRIVVSNIGTEPAVLAIIADDVKTYPSLAGGATASAQTNVGGRYQVLVVMTPENTAAYRANLVSLRGLVEKAVDRETDATEKTRLFLDLAGIKAAIAALEMTNAAGCSGVIELDEDEASSVNATVRWQPQEGGGFWDTTCGSTTR
jgi:hypothetical protein